MTIARRWIAFAPLAAAALLLGAIALPVTRAEQAKGGASKTDAAAWSINATIIEACSCQMFCPCYFSTKPAPAHAGHGAGMGSAGMHYCRFNMGYKVNKGSSGGVKFDGARFWIAGDLGDDFGDGEAEWAEVTFDPSVTKEQRDAIAPILLKHVYPLKWKAFTVGADAPVEWTATTARAHAKLGGGKAGEIVLVHNPTAMTGQPTLLRNVKYFGAARNDGFVLMPNEVEAYRRGAKPFEYKGTNGFMITIDMTSQDVK
jgi:hypothetical protein